MSTSIPRPIAAGACLALVGILFGFLLGGAFGGIEGQIKQRLHDSGTAALETVYKGDVAARDAVVGKSFAYLVRAHLHGGAIGAAALGSILAMVLFCPLGRVAQLSALAFGLGAILYPLFWLLAGLTAPGLGGTGAAKEALSFLAVPAAGLNILGLCGTLWCMAGAAFRGAGVA